MSQKSNATDYFLLAVLAVLVVGSLVLAALIIAPKIKAILPTPKPAATEVPGIFSVGEDAPLARTAEQPFIADEIERITNGGTDVLHVEERGDFAVSLVIWVQEDLTEAQAIEMDTLLASEYAIVRLMHAQQRPQLGNMVFIVDSAYDCIAMGDPEAPLRCAPDVDVGQGYLIPDEGLDLLNE